MKQVAFASSCSTQSIQKERYIPDIAIILKAAEFAAHRHRDQKRKGRSQRPYIGHCIEVARLIADSGDIGDSDILAAALLHDTVEDTATSHEEIDQAFGHVVGGYVRAVTDDKTLTRSRQRELQIEHAPHMSDGAKLIKLADKISNIREIGVDPPMHWEVQRCEEYFTWGARVVDALGRINPALEALFAQTLADSTRLLARQPSRPGGD